LATTTLVGAEAFALSEFAQESAPRHGADDAFVLT
jgi:hypothetical protein